MVFKYKITIFLLFLIGLVACERFTEIGFIPLKVDFIPSLYVIQEGDSVFFTQRASIVANSFFWDFDDKGASSNEANPRYQFKRRGTYRVKLVTAKADDKTKDSISKAILVLPITSPDNAISQSFGQSNVDEVSSNFVRVSDGFILLSRRGLNALYILKVDFAMNPQWSKTISNLTTGQIFGRSIQPTTDNGFIIVGYYKYNTLENDAFILKLDDKRNEVWRRLKNTNQDEKYEIVLEINNQYVVAGTNSGTDGSSSISIESYSQEGIPGGDSKTLGSTWRVQDFQPTADGGFIMAANQGDNPLLVKLKPNRDLDWNFPLDDFKGNAFGVTQLADGDYVLVGEVATAKSDSTNAFIAKINDNGSAEVWRNRLILFHDSFYDVAENGNRIFVLGIHHNPLSLHDVLLCKYNPSNGELAEDVKFIGNDNNNYAYKLNIDSQGFISLIGSTDESKNALQNIYLLRFKEN